MPDPSDEIGIFLSYSRKDKAFCDQLMDDLREVDKRLRLIRDEESLEIGRSLHDEIKKNLESAHFVVSLISRHSLSSSWVLWEIQKTLNTEAGARKVELIPAYLDPVFLDDNGVKAILGDLQATRQKVANQIPELTQQNLDIAHLTLELSALARTINELPGLVSYLRGVNAVDLSREQYEKSFRRITKRLLGVESPPPVRNSATKGANADVQGRVARVHKLLFQAGGPTEREESLTEAAIQAMQCVLDFATANDDLLDESATLPSNVRNAFSILKGKELLEALDGIVKAIVRLLRKVVRPA
jgi:hypothetical protein